MHTGSRASLIIAILVVTLAGSLPAQAPITVTGRQDLTFGALLPGVSLKVSRTDRANAGQFEMRGQQRAEVRVDLTLPPALVSGSGAQLPLQFAADDGGFSNQPAVPTMQVFDPRVPLVTDLGNNGRLYIFLGGTALPGAQQAAGIYAATITLTVAYTGN